jgi:hypothetical protein
MKIQCPICTEIDQKKLSYSADIGVEAHVHIFQCNSCGTCITNDKLSEWEFINALGISVPSIKEPWKDYENN